MWSLLFNIFIIFQGDFDIGILNNPDYLVHEKPLNRADMYNLPEGTDVSKYINDVSY